ncbi:AbrB/MazE/SpoVT family DNA-binding domain-containing protein [Ruminococcaceae bacterium OttesenSCG-928-N02]|nr:AbrB/MazE/SpoVT family DNA-binding domain-containing protein [Ruminococcaceae bacterium OttesenSCG-928-N02]
MKSTGIVRKIDDLGRIVLPIELRRGLGIDERDPIEIFVQDDNIILRKYAPSCIFCGEENGLVQHHGKNVCEGCCALLQKK